MGLDQPQARAREVLLGQEGIDEALVARLLQLDGGAEGRLLLADGPAELLNLGARGAQRRSHLIDVLSDHASEVTRLDVAPPQRLLVLLQAAPRSVVPEGNVEADLEVDLREVLVLEGASEAARAVVVDGGARRLVRVREELVPQDPEERAPVVAGHAQLDGEINALLEIRARRVEGDLGGPLVVFGGSEVEAR